MRVKKRKERLEGLKGPVTARRLRGALNAIGLLAALAGIA